VSEPDFESQIAALYRETPSMPDDAAFVAQVDARIDSYLWRRRLILTLLGAIGGAITFAVLQRFDAVPMLKSILVESYGLIGSTLSVPWGTPVLALLVVLLVLPAFVRTVIDPK